MKQIPNDEQILKTICTSTNDIFVITRVQTKHQEKLYKCNAGLTTFSAINIPPQKKMYHLCLILKNEQFNALTTDSNGNIYAGNDNGKNF